MSNRRRRSAWGQALELARQTPPERNRYVDFLRAVSILAVVSGHWLIAAPWFSPDGLRLDHLLAIDPRTQWLTLVFQVMPVFFIVGGYSNAASWDAARRKGTPFGIWYAGRTRRLIAPVLPLLIGWGACALLLPSLGVSEALLRNGSKLALVPLWFLAVYVLICAFVPLTRAAWKRFGLLSYFVPLGAAAVVDYLRFGHGLVGVAWVNYLFVWIAVHQMGYLWRDGRLAGPARALPWAVAGALAWTALARFGPYPIAMVGVPGDPVSNTLPPTVMLPALGAAHAGVLLAIEPAMRRWLGGVRVWAATVLVNGTIMSVYLWHLTATALLIGLAARLGGVGLHWTPGSGAWWSGRIPWFVAMAALLALILAFVGRYERPRSREVRQLGPLRTVAGVLLTGGGLASAAFAGLSSPPRAALVLIVIAGAWLLDVTRFGR
jgi:hypothetical protein